MLVTFVLGIEFIWIDSMCIIQDNNYDKEVQIAQMPRIYNSAILTISAVGMSSVHDPLFRTLRKPIGYAKSIFKLPACGAPNSIDCAILAPSHELEVTSMEEDNATEALDQRAWTFQESLLSRRLLKFTSSTMRWECRRHLEIDFDDGKRTRILDGYPLHPAVCRMRHRSNLNYILRSGNLHCPDGRQSDIPETGFDQPDIYPWHMIVEEYTRRSLSFLHDRALAISGIAERIAEKTDDLYYAGLWRSCLVSQLAWYDSSAESNPDPEHVTGWVLSSIRFISAESHPGCRVHQWGGAFSLPIGGGQDSEQDKHSLVCQPEESSKELNSPSWSWISNSGPVRFKVSGIRFTLEIVSVIVQYSIEAAPFGNVDYGHLTVRGAVKSTTHAQCIVQDLPFNSTVGDSMVLLKLGEKEFSASGLGGSAICLVLKQKTNELWVRIGLSEVPDTDWIETRTITIA
jgi:Heterokaryon incompatibility protein (HET)